jgi:hypothetical protein
MSEDRKCTKCGTDLRLVEDNNRASVGGVPDTAVEVPQVRIRGTRRLGRRLVFQRPQRLPVKLCPSLTSSNFQKPIRERRKTSNPS